MEFNEYNNNNIAYNIIKCSVEGKLNSPTLFKLVFLTPKLANILLVIQQII